MSQYLYYGGDYNPEQWPRAVWEEDIALMRQAGVNLVTVGVFSWARLEPREGSYSFGWLQELLDMLGAGGIGVDLATPTAAPPAWLSVGYPEVLPVDARGTRYSHGSRQAICICSPDYREKALSIVGALADAVGQHRALRMWHVHNEYACHVPYCYCDNHAEAFREWLKHRYGSVEALNEAWGSAFWSQTYTGFGEVIPPRLTAAFTNPAAELDYKRFSSTMFLDEYYLERQILKEARPDLPVTTNFMGFYKPIDYFSWAGAVDVISTDNYPDMSDPEWPLQSAMHYDLVRSLNKKAQWMVMEQTPARVTWHFQNVPKRPGHMRAMCYQAVARGARGLMFFQWRAARAGAEKFHSAMLPHAGTAAPGWAETVSLGGELGALEDMEDARVEAKVAMLFSWPNWWAVEGHSQPAGRLNMSGQLMWLYRALFANGATCDFCQPDEALGVYEAVLVPSLYLVSEQQGANVASYVEAGGTVVVSFWSGIVDECDSVYLGPYGGPLRPLLGCDVVDVAPMRADEAMEVEWEDGDRCRATLWADVTEAGDGKVLARYAGGPLSGRPAVVATDYGDGRAYYVGCRLDERGLDLLYALVPALAPRQGAPHRASGVERVVRAGTDRWYEFLINYSHGPRVVDVREGGLELLTRRILRGPVTLQPAEVAIVRHEA